MHFFNPYHFVDVIGNNGFTPRYPLSASHDAFSLNCGKLSVELEFVTPGFIPHTEKTEYIISDDTLNQEDDTEQHSPAVHRVLERFISQKKAVAEISERKGPKIRFNPDCRGWDPSNPKIGKYIIEWDEKDRFEEKYRDWLEGEIRHIKDTDGKIKYFIISRSPSRWAHKKMDHYSINGLPAIPLSSFKGMLRGTVESLSNGCFPGYEPDSRDENHMFYRLDISNNNNQKEARNLKPVVIKKKGNDWVAVTVNQANILSPHLFNRITATGENKLAAYYNTKGKYYEKIGARGNDPATGGDPTGLHKYKAVKASSPSRSPNDKLDDIASKSAITIGGFAIDEINGVKLNKSIHTYNKKFPYASESSRKKTLYAIVRFKDEKKLNNNGKPFFAKTYKIKQVSDDPATLKTAIASYNSSEPLKGSGPGKGEWFKIKYAVCEIRIKTAFDIDKKTHHKAFFVFGEEDFDSAVDQKIAGNKETLTNDLKSRFRSLLRQRKLNAQKITRDPENLNQKIANEAPNDLEDGMLAYSYNFQGSMQYLTYTAVPQKSYNHCPGKYLKHYHKTACSKLDDLCPACQIFGTVSLKSENEAEGKVSALKGKLIFSGGKLIRNSGNASRGFITLPPLSSPKPTYYPFYIVDNRKQNGTGYQRNYDRVNMRIGRKIYLHHPKNQVLNFPRQQISNLNVSIRPYPEGAAFQFDIHFQNLTNYELGLLIYSLNMKYKNHETGHHLGMGKPLGLGSCRLKITEAKCFDLDNHYRSLVPDSGKPINLKSVENMFKYIQGAGSHEEFHQRLAKVNGKNLGAVILDKGETEIENEFFSRTHIHEYHILSSINVNPDLKCDAIPICYGGGATESFKWYQEAKQNNSQRLFTPSELENNISAPRRYALTKGPEM